MNATSSMFCNDEYIVEILASAGLIPKSVSTLISSGIVTKQQIYEAIANAFGLEFIKLSELQIPEEVIREVPSDIATRYKVVPTEKNGNFITIAYSDPTDPDTPDTLRYVLQRDITIVLATEEDITIALQKYYPQPKPTLVAT